MWIVILENPGFLIELGSFKIGQDGPFLDFIVVLDNFMVIWLLVIWNSLV